MRTHRHAAHSGGTVRDLAVGDSAVLGDPLVDLMQRRRLAELGLRRGEAVRMVLHSVGGARVVSVRGSRIALDATTAALLPVQDGPS